MVGESVAVIIILLVAVIMSIRSGNVPLAKMAFPFFLVPLIYLLGALLVRAVHGAPDELYFIRILTIVVGGISAVGTSFLMANISKGHVNQSSLRIYKVFAPIANAALAFAYFLRLR